MRGTLKVAWRNAYYRITCLYIAIVVTLIFGFQLYRYFYDLPSGSVKQCGDNKSLAVLIPVIGVIFDG